MILLIVGVELESTFDFDSFIIALTIVVSLVLYGINEFTWKVSNAQSVLLGLSILGIGSLLVLSHQRGRTQIIDLPKGDSLLIHIDEISKSDKTWKKSICTSEWLISNEEQIRHTEKLLLYFNADNLQVGDVLVINANLNQIKNKGNPGEFDAKNYWGRKGIRTIGFIALNEFKIVNHREPSWGETKLEEIRTGLTNILSKYLVGDELAIAEALILGDKKLLTDDVKTSFSKAGAMHVLAVSGLHVGIVLYLLIFIFSKFPKILSKKKALILSLLIIWLYAGVTGFSPSVLRATIMFSILTVGGIIGKTSNSINVLFFSAFLMIIFNPFIIYDLGFQLSYLAMIGILTLYKPISKFFYIQHKILRKIWEGTAVGISAQLLTFPLTLYYFHQFPNYFVLTNIGMMVFAGVTLGVGLLLFTLSWVSLFAKLIALILSICLSSMLFFIQFIEHLPGSVAKGFVISSELVLILYCVLLSFLLFNRLKRVVIINTVVALFIFSGIQFVRYENISSDELVVFNSNQLVFSVKIDENIFCFRSDQEKSVKQADLLVLNYEKIKPGNVRMIDLKLGITNFNMSHQEIEFDYNLNRLLLSVNDKKYIIRTNYKLVENDDEVIIDMPYLQENQSHIHLNDGAHTIMLN